MNKNILQCIIFFFICYNLNAQIKINSEVDLANYPTVSFDIYNRNPDFKTELNYNFFRISKAKEVLIDSVKISKINDTINYSKKNKCVLILIESINNPQRYEQVNTFFKALNNSLYEFVNPGDKIQIGTFHLRRDDTRVIVPLLNNFVDDIRELKKAIKDFDASSNRERKLVSEIPGAIREGVDLLAEVTGDFNKSILLMSEESINNYSSEKIEDVIDYALEKKIVVNSIKYNRYNHRQHAIPFLADQTYGESYVLDVSTGELKNSNKKKQLQAEKIITSTLNNVVKRAKGTKSRATIYLKDVFKDGNEYKFKIKEINSNHEHEFNFKAPGNWYFGQFEKKPLITSLVSVFLMILLFIIFKKLKAKQKSRKLKLLDEKQKQIQLQKQQQTELLSQQKEIESLKKQEQQRINELKKTKLLKDKKTKESKLIKQMQSLGNFPILKFSDSKSTNTFEINKPSMSIGRDESNDIHILNPNISRKHFKIIFEASNYVIVDNNSTNGMIINGYKLKKSSLKNGDIIEIADATFTFYL